MGDGGKGSAPRPFSVSNEEYANRWDEIFGKDVPKLDKDKCVCGGTGECQCPPEKE
jgi:hypothetical protein